jgi:hypothetical protein
MKRAGSRNIFESEIREEGRMRGGDEGHDYGQTINDDDVRVKY